VQNVQGSSRSPDDLRTLLLTGWVAEALNAAGVEP
jgi:hypothetical protein